MRIYTSEAFETNTCSANIAVEENIEAMILLDGLQPSIWCGYSNAAKAIGRVWNGASSLSFGIARLKAGEMSALLCHLTEKLEALGDDGIALPTRNSVRLVEAHVTNDELLIVDFTIDGVCIPIAFPDHLFHERGRDWKECLSVRYLEHVDAARKHRKELSKRDIAMRSSFAALVRNIGHDCRGAWLRMSPISCLSTIGFDRDPYDHALVIWDEKLDEKLEGYTVWNARELRSLAPIYRNDQRRLFKRRSKTREASALGMVDTVTEALLQALGRQAEGVWAECVEKMRRGEEIGFSHLGRNGAEYLFEFRQGVLSCSIRFNGGIYTAGRLQLNSELNETLYASAKGRLLSDFVDHPAFRQSKVKISKVSRYQGATELHHQIRTKLIYPQVQSIARPIGG
ncbi:hypothetical protein GRI39_07060 [Altererythrobacter indicus]|uniref:Uncharacterized protein n=1 Tax=Altericroceibacterium indicum TaxID=374177 RepID=A0A845A8Z0_9SPHN|nr:hypothetical protein [Altericroceibacterium indicum]MXP25799.1 hypothetical protein [Altericroceibacterium indicum]